jgi:recombination protein RecT
MKYLSAIAAKGLDPTRVAKIVLNAVSQTPALAKCTVDSVFRSAVQAAELGLEAGSSLQRAYLVPYGDRCQLIVGYKGLCELAYRSGQVISIEARPVFEGDLWEYQITDEGARFRHVPGSETSPTKMTHAYCVIKLKGGGKVVDVMTKSEVEAIRNRSKVTSGPWATDYAEMAKKTVVRRALKLCPMSIEMGRAEKISMAAETGEQVNDFEFIDADWETEGQQESRSDQIANALPGTTMEAELVD